MRQIFPLGDYVRRTGDTMTGVLTIKRDTTDPFDPHLRFQCSTTSGTQMPIGFYDEVGNLLILMRGDRAGDLTVSPKSGGVLYAPWLDLGTPVYWRPHTFPFRLNPRRVMMVETLLFG